MRPVPSPFAHPNGVKPESKALVVAVSVLQLSLVIIVWLLAIVPAGLLALAMIAKAAIVAVAAKPGKGPRPTVAPRVSHPANDNS